MKNQFVELGRHLGSEIIGQKNLIERLLIGILCGGHMLLEGVPGLAKTRAVRALAGGLALQFQRIQFTPDLIPGDLTGSDIFLPQEGRFQFVAGPVFSDIVLADEVNRAPPKVQSALLEAMQEGQVTVGGQTRALSPVFMVIATQNPLEQEGTYPLPEAQLDRFFLKVHIDYPDAEEELAILHHEQARRKTPGEQAAASAPAMTAETLLQARNAANDVYMDEMLERYIIALVGTTRDPAARDAELGEWISRGASPRATLALAQAARARAFLHDRDFVTPDDIVELACDALNHRIAPSFAARAAGITPQHIIARIVETVPAP
ncbi:MAG TPA: AAA family ATPase [Gammaproteobacteria bacterium]|nr:AAA family ATPase [Gammaproteobacteria bacterium]